MIKSENAEEISAFFVTNLCAVHGLSSLHHASGEHTLYKTAVGVGMHFQQKGSFEGKGKHEYCQYANGRSDTIRE